MTNTLVFVVYLEYADGGRQTAGGPYYSIDKALTEFDFRRQTTEGTTISLYFKEFEDKDLILRTVRECHNSNDWGGWALLKSHEDLTRERRVALLKKKVEERFSNKPVTIYFPEDDDLDDCVVVGDDRTVYKTYLHNTFYVRIGQYN